MASFPREVLSVVLEFLPCHDRRMLTRVDRHARSVKPKLSACGGVGCLRAACVRANWEVIFSAAAFRDLPTEEQHTHTTENHDEEESDCEETDEYALASATRAWAKRYVRPVLTRPLTELVLPRIARPAVILAFLREIRAEVCVVNFTSTAEGDENASWSVDELYRISGGPRKPCPVVLRPPREGISALIFAVRPPDWDKILYQVPRLKYLSMLLGPWDRYAQFSKALRLVPNLTFLNIGINGGALCADDTQPRRSMPVHKVLEHAKNVEVLRSIEGSHFSIDVVRKLKRTCCPRLREMHTDIYNIEPVLAPWNSTEELDWQCCRKKVIPDCDGVIWIPKFAEIGWRSSDP